MIKFPEINQNINNKNMFFADQQYKKPHFYSPSLKSQPTLSSSISNNQQNLSIFFIPQLSASSCNNYLNNSSSSKQILGKQNNHTDRIAYLCKKQSATPKQSEETIEESVKFTSIRRKRVVLKQNISECGSIASYLFSNSNLSEFQQREKLATPPLCYEKQDGQNAIINKNEHSAQPLKRRRTNIRQNLYVKSNYSCILSEKNLNDIDYNPEASNSTNNSSKDLKTKDSNNSIELPSPQKQSQFTIQSSKIFSPIYYPQRQPSIVMSPSLNKNINDSKLSLFENDDNLYNFTKSQKKMLPPLISMRGILKNNSESNLMAKHSQKKSVSFNQKTQVF